MKRVIIVGSDGQDGRILHDRLKVEGCAVLGIAKGTTRVTGKARNVEPVDIEDRRSVLRAVESWSPDAVYYLCAYHHSSQESAGSDVIGLFEKSYAVHVEGLLYFLDAIKAAGAGTRLFYAGSSLAFGEAARPVQDETTPLNPRCVYGITKANGVRCCRFYRETQGVGASVGFLYNHESIYRQEKFVSQKIIRGAIDVWRGRREKLVLGDLSARIDWGYAPDYVDAMMRIVALPEAEDFVIATGKPHSVQDFVETAFGLLGVDWKTHVEEEKGVLKRKRGEIAGDASKLREKTGWKPSVTFEEMVEIMMNAAVAAENEKSAVTPA